MLLKRLIPIDFIKKQYRHQLVLKWKKAKEKSPLNKKTKTFESGFNIIGFFTAATGLGEAARRNLSAISQTSIPFSVINYENEVPDHQKFVFPFNQYNNDFLYAINLIHINPLEFPYLWNHFQHENLLNRYTIGVWYWELSEFPDEWCDTFDLVDEIWVASEFVRKSIQAKTTKPVIIIPPSIEVVFDTQLTRKDFGLPQESFLFLVAYDVLSNQERKNPMGAIHAFKKAFSPGDMTVGLVIKINNANHNLNHKEALKAELNGWKNCYFLEETYPKEKFNALLNSIDVYVSLHRSEGFGLIPAEAMYLGKPVIMTNWSGNMDYMTQDNCCPVDFEMIPVGGKKGIYNSNQVWVEPDQNQASKFMIKLAQEKNFYNMISKNSRNSIKSLYDIQELSNMISMSWGNIGKN